MPSFPDSVFAPANRSNGQTIDASHMNGVQDELVAIEGGYLNGTARLNSSNSTVANLSVTGGTTLASLDINGNSSLASSVTFGTIPYVFPSSGGSTGHVLTCVSTSGSTMGLEWRSPAAQNVARVFLQDIQDLGSSINSTITSFASQDYVLNSSIHSTATNPERLTPQSTGVYRFEAQVLMRAAPTGNSQMNVQIRDSSGVLIGQGAAGFIGSVGGGMAGQAVGLKRFDAIGGHVTVSLNITGGGSTNALSTGLTATWFAMAKL